MKEEEGKVQLTKRDMDLLEMINELGYVDIHYIRKLWRIGRRTTYRRVQALLLANYLVREKIVFNNAGIYQVTTKGVEINPNSLPLLRKFSAANYRHNILVAKLSLSLLQKFGGRFISERRLRHENPNSKAEKHYCDGVLESEEKSIGIEVELTPKSQRRLEQIMKQHQKNFDYQEVWYFYDKKEVKTKLEKVTEGLSFIKLFDLKEFVE